MVVSPHPDDEILGAGGLIRAAARAGCEMSILSVTDGEAAYPDWPGLEDVRCQELRDALSAVTPLTVTVERLKIPDGRVNEHRARLFATLDRSVTPSTLLVAPYERDGHPDHDATGEVCCHIAKSRAATLWRYPVWTWHHSKPDRFAGDAWGRLQLGAADVQAKARAIGCFKSQLRPAGRAPIVPEHVLPYFGRAYEAFLV
jgi:LmbE family N-acetylglucosaminyl deacetylase